MVSQILYPLQYRELVRQALHEDMGRGGDLTGSSIIPLAARARGKILARQKGIVAGIEVARLAFTELDSAVQCETFASDGDALDPGQPILECTGNARALLAAERVALNFLAHLSGVATRTARVVSLLEAAPASRARVVCTRKTTPLLRTLEKYAVVVGGGVNHRFGLDDGVLIKDNHLALVGDISTAVAAVRDRVGHMVKIEVEVDTLQQLEQALACRIDAVLLDNMTNDELRRGVEMVKMVDAVERQTVTEASGGVTEETIGGIASTGVDLISMGALTHSAPAMDLSLDIVPA